MATANARKLKMQAQDRERQRNAPLEVKMKNYDGNPLLANVQNAIDEGYDDVKGMNKLVLESKIMTVRDQQLEENRLLEQNWVQEQKRLDMMMEIERLKAIQQEMAREERAAQARKRGQQVLVDQIADRQLIRQKIEDEAELEKAQLHANIEKVRREDAERLEAKRQRMQIMNKEVRIANKNAEESKVAARQEEKRIDEKIADFQRQKVEREEAEAREQQRIKEEKEREVQRLRDLQERANDR